MEAMTSTLEPQQKWPDILWIVRHGQSAGNVARDAAEAAGLPLIDITTRDMDTPLSELGREQAQALGRWFAEMSPDRRPSVVLCSPTRERVRPPKSCSTPHRSHAKASPSTSTSVCARKSSASWTA
jgi:hypothetical protein